MSKTYDIPLRKLFKTIPVRFLELLGVFVDPNKVKFLDVKLPKLFEREADLVFEYQGNIYHIEIQSVDDPKMAYRMLYYYLLLRENYNRIPYQFVVYVGEKPPKRMKPILEEPNLRFSYTLVDINQINCLKLLESPFSSDWALAILCQMDNELEGIKKILKKVALIKEPQERKRQLEFIFHIARLRPKRLDLLKREEIVMPIIIELEKDPLFKEGLKKGLKQGLELGLEEAKKKDAINLYRKLKLTPKQIGEILEINPQKVKKWLKEANLLTD